MQARSIRAALSVAAGVLVGLLALPAMADPAPSGADLAESCRLNDGPERTCKSIEAGGESAAHACREASEADTAATHGECAGIDGQDLNPVLVDAWQHSWTKRALDDQRTRAERRPLGLGQVIGTHNSFNSRAYDVTLSGTDSNQLLSMYDQLRMGVRSLELDVHWIPSAHAGGFEVMLCHGNDYHVGCTTESQTFERGLAEVRQFLHDHPGEFVVLELQDELHRYEQPSADAHRRATNLLNAAFPAEWIVRPADLDADPTTCDDLPLGTSIDDMRADGGRIAVFSSCAAEAGRGGWNTTVFSNDHVRHQSGLDDYDYRYDTGCQRFGFPTIEKWTRSWDDTTWLSTMVDGEDWVVDEETIIDWSECGLNMPSLDDLGPGDRRMDAFVWSWDDGIEPGSTSFVRQTLDGRWRPVSPRARFVVCRRPDGSWLVADRVVDPLPSLQPFHWTCFLNGARVGAPSTGFENRQVLELTAGAPDVMIVLD